MESKASRTLVKSPPELWELADDLARMEAWMAGLVGAREPISVEVTDRDPKRVLAWRANDGYDHRGRIAIELIEGGLGTSVAVTAQHIADPVRALSALERLLDELASSERMPFSRG